MDIENGHFAKKNIEIFLATPIFSLDKLIWRPQTDLPSKTFGNPPSFWTYESASLEQKENTIF